MNHRYHVDLHSLETNLTTSNVFSTTSLQTDPDLYALKNKKKPSRLDLKNLLKDPLPLPQSHLVSTNRLAYVEALVDINAVVIESIWYPTTTMNATHHTHYPHPQHHPQHHHTKESRVSPVVPLRTFIQEVLKRSRTTYSTLQTALFYIFRARPAILQHLQQEELSWQHSAYVSCGRRMFLASLVVASKFVQDKTYRNSAWAKIAGLPVQEINTAERYFLELMDYRLYIDQPIFDRWHRLLHMRTQARMHHIPTSLRDLASCLSFAPPQTTYHSPSPIIYELPSSHCVTTSSGCHHACMCSQCSPLKAPPALSLSLPSSISSSPAQTPIQVSPVRTSQKRKYESKEHTTLLDKKHCRFWQ
ncbi:cyclin-domain-containing protein [Gilbertella persicaria]|uniref:cyclin-domain-containing protein n=1 Tax=Gilbertella persicaria TaxID=101096 RepID=UPI00221F8D9A|nr:cyclin-domain-containing protein [Gilbertella persicaria]KAI8087575.1 cyclin-domain-containing protein [Gilbertella persicaria]